MTRRTTLANLQHSGEIGPLELALAFDQSLNDLRDEIYAEISQQQKATTKKLAGIQQALKSNQETLDAIARKILPSKGERYAFGTIWRSEVLWLLSFIPVLLAAIGWWIWGEYQKQIIGIDKIRAAQVREIQKVRSEIQKTRGLSATGFSCVEARFGERIAGLRQGSPLVQPDPSTLREIEVCLDKVGDVVDGFRAPLE